MRIAVVTICTVDLNFRNYTVANSRDYCERHGYDFMLYEDKIDPTSATITNKTIAVLQNIDHYDWIFMKDADSLFYNFQFKLEKYIDDDYNYIGSMSKLKGVVNLGHLLIKCTPEVKAELESVLVVLRQRVKDKGEQPVYNEFWDTGKISPVKRLPKHVLNSHSIGKEDWDWEREWGLPMEDLEELDRKGIEYHKTFNDIKRDTLIVHYPGVFLKTGNYVIERHVAEGRIPEYFSFSESYLPEFISMCDEIKRINQHQTIKKKSVSTNCKPRVKRSEMRKIKHNNPKRR